jgi:hypothetical protein
MAPVLVSVFLPGFTGEQREVTITCTRIIFPMTGVLVLSAWALGILNSHRKFFVSYTAPVLWNAAMIAVLLIFGTRLDQRGLVIALAWGALIGGALQFLVQLPWILRSSATCGRTGTLRSEGAAHGDAQRRPGHHGARRRAAQRLGDLFLASFLFDGAVAALGYAQTFYMLPVSLFGMSIAAAELPELSRAGAHGSEAEPLRGASRPACGRWPCSSCRRPSATWCSATSSSRHVRARRVRTRRHAARLVHPRPGTPSACSRPPRHALYSSAFFALQRHEDARQDRVLRVLTSALLGGTLMVLLEPVTVRG